MALQPSQRTHKHALMLILRGACLVCSSAEAATDGTHARMSKRPVSILPNVDGTGYSASRTIARAVW